MYPGTITQKFPKHLQYSLLKKTTEEVLRNSTLPTPLFTVLYFSSDCKQKTCFLCFSYIKPVKVFLGSDSQDFCITKFNFNSLSSISSSTTLTCFQSPVFSKYLPLWYLIYSEGQQGGVRLTSQWVCWCRPVPHACVQRFVGVEKEANLGKQWWQEWGRNSLLPIAFVHSVVGALWDGRHQRNYISFVLSFSLMLSFISFSCCKG